MANVLFRYSPSLTVYVARLRGTLLPTPGHSVPNFKDASSFYIATDAAEMRLTTGQLAALMNSWLLRSPKAQLKDVQISVEGRQLRIRGTMKKGLHFPFNAIAEPGITDDNRIRFTIKQVKAVDLPVKGLMDALGLSMEDLVSQNGMQGMSVDKDSFLIDPQTAFPPPQIRAKVTSVRVSQQGVVISFGQGAPKLPNAAGRNFIAMRGGTIKYGRDEMFNSDLTMIDSTPADPFEFYLQNYWCQIVAGTIKAQPDQAWKLYVPDYSKLPKGSCHPTHSGGK